MTGRDPLVRVGNVADAVFRPAVGFPDAHLLVGEEDRLAGRPARFRSGSERRQAAAASLQVSGEDAHVVRRLDAFERPGRPRIDLDDPGALAVPHEVDAEQPAQPNYEETHSINQNRRTLTLGIWYEKSDWKFRVGALPNNNPLWLRQRQLFQR